MCEYSFIIPVYGCADYLESCVLSILENTNSSFEIILIDDGTVDASGKVADSLEEEYEEIITFHKVNGGAGSARNLGIEKASGRYLVFIDGDDTFEGKAFGEFVKQDPLKEANLLVYGMFFDYYKDSNLHHSNLMSASHNSVVSKAELLEQYRGYFYDNALSSACNKVFDADIIRQHNLRFDESMRLYEDLDFVLRYLPHCQTIKFTDKGFYHYRNDLDNNHINGRVKDITRLSDDLCKLIFHMNQLWDANLDAEECLQIGAEVYLGGLTQHLLITSYSNKELEKHVKEYYFKPEFQNICQTERITLTGLEKTLVSYIENNKWTSMNVWLFSLKTKRILRRIVKKILRKE